MPADPLRLDLSRFRVDPVRFSLRDHDPADAAGLTPKAAAAALDATQKELADLHDRLYASGRHGLLAILQGRDASGKDGAIRRLLSGLDPAGCQVHSFKVPSAAEVRHDFLWRCAREAPERGAVAVFNRSYYEEVVVVRVHPELLAAQRLPPGATGDGLWERRLEDIVAYERYLARNGIRTVKAYLNVSKEEQRRRLLKRIDDPAKQWKFSAADHSERLLWEEYDRAYEEALRATSTPEAHWYVIPADHKWLARLAVAELVAETLRGLDLSYPEPMPAAQAEMARVRALLERDD